MSDAKKSVNAPERAENAGSEDEVSSGRRGHKRRITIEIAVNAALWIAFIVIMGSGAENGIGYFQQPRHSLWLPLIHGALWNALTYIGNAFWLMPHYLKQRRYSAYLAGVLVLAAGVLLFKTLGEKVLILAAYPDLRDVPFHRLALENSYVLPVMILLSLFYRFARDGLVPARADETDPGEAQPEDIWIKSGTRRDRVAIDDILGVKAADNYVVFELEGRKIMALMSMNDALGALPAERFMRIHRSHIVALDKVESVSADAVVVAGESLPIGRTYRNEVRRRYLSASTRHRNS